MTWLVGEMQTMYPAAPWLSWIVLGRVLHRCSTVAIVNMAWGMHVAYCLPCGSPRYVAATVSRLPEIQKSRREFQLYTNQNIDWSFDSDQRQAV